MAYKILPPQARLRQRLDYNPDTGELRWKSCPPSDFENKRTYAMLRGRDFAQPAGYMHRGRFEIGIDGGYYEVGRVIWKWMTGEEPANLIDHKDCDPSNNRWDNLRPATTIENPRNSRRHKDNRSGYKGVTWVPHIQKWQARIRVNGHLLNLGCFLSPQEAHETYCKAADQFFGAFARHS